jgi:hypothetical protein
MITTEHASDVVKYLANGGFSRDTDVSDVRTDSAPPRLVVPYVAGMHNTDDVARARKYELARTAYHARLLADQWYHEMRLGTDAVHVYWRDDAQGNSLTLLRCCDLQFRLGHNNFAHYRPLGRFIDSLDALATWRARGDAVMVAYMADRAFSELQADGWPRQVYP